MGNPIEVQIRGPPYIRLMETRNISSTTRHRLTPYLYYQSLAPYTIEFTVYESSTSVYNFLHKQMLKGTPIFFDFSDEVPNLWGHMLVTNLAPSRQYSYWDIDVRAYLIPSWGSVLSKTKQANILIDGDHSPFIGSTFWNLVPTLDTVNKTITWEAEIYNPYVDLDIKFDWNNVVVSAGGTGSYDWETEIGTKIFQEETVLNIRRISGSHDHVGIYYSEDGSNTKNVNLDLTPFSYYSYRSNSPVWFKVKDDSWNTAKSWDGPSTSLRRKTKLLSEWQDFTSIPDWSQVCPFIEGWSSDLVNTTVEIYGFSYGRAAVFTVRVPEGASGNNLKIESYDYSSSSYSEITTLDLSDPSSATVDLSKLYYYGGNNASSINGDVMPLAVYHLEKDNVYVEPTSFGAGIDPFPTIGYDNSLGKTFAIGVLLGPNDNEDTYCRVKLRLTYTYDSISDTDYLVVG